MPGAHGNGVPSLTIAPLTLADTHLAPIDPQFLQMVSDHLGNVLTSDDANDVDINAALLSLNDDSQGFDTLTAHLAEADFVEGQFATANTDPIAGDIQSFTDAGNTIVGEAGTTVTPTDPAPTPTPTPAPEPTGGGGGGGGTVQGGNAGSVPTPVATMDPGGGYGYGWSQQPTPVSGPPLRPY